MTITIKSGQEDVVSLPTELLRALNLKEGDVVQIIVQGDTLRVTRLDKFLRLRGTLADDQEFDRAMDWIQGAWQAWTPPSSF